MAAFLLRKIQPHDLLEFTNAFADANGNIISAPFDIRLPLEILYTLVFTERNGRTTITLTGQPVNANNDEQAAFLSINESMQKGFGSTFNQLSIYLETIGKENKNVL